jgi:hypothetical protein
MKPIMAYRTAVTVPPCRDDHDDDASKAASENVVLIFYNVVLRDGGMI